MRFNYHDSQACDWKRAGKSQKGKKSKQESPDDFQYDNKVNENN